MTDNEIIKATDLLDKFDFFYGQRAGRELWNEKPVDIQDKDIESFSNDVAFLKDFINRQKAEIERLTINMNAFGLGMKREKERADTAKSEAVKEFAGRLKAEIQEKKYKYVTDTNYSKTCNAVIDSCVVCIDNLVKEMVGDL